MPNHIKNRLSLIGDQKEIDKLVKEFSTTYDKVESESFDGNLTYKKDGNYGWLNKTTNVFTQRDKGDCIGVPHGFVQEFEEAWTRFPDFNKIVPMNPDLNIDSDGWISPLDNKYSRSDTVYDHAIKLKKLYDSNKDRGNKALENFSKGFANFIKTGHACWYSWSIENWGTKWNAYSCESFGLNTYEFETAWSPVPELIRKLNKSYPDIEILYEYADEDTSSNCGSMSFIKGEVHFIRFENGSKEAFEMAFKLRPNCQENYVLVNGNYKYKEEEE